MWKKPDQNRQYGVFGAGMILILLAGFGLSLGSVGTAARSAAADLRLGTSGLFSGRTAAVYQQDYEQSFPARQPALEAWTGIKYSLFRDGLPGLAVGADGWLFSDEELYGLGNASMEAVRVRAVADHIGTVRDQLAARGVELLVLPVPAKARIYHDRLGRYRFPRVAMERYQLLLDELALRSIAVIDLATPFARVAAQGRALFLKTDTHWTPEGASLSARLSAEWIRGRPYFPQLARRPFSVSLGETSLYQGDLLNFLPLGRLAGQPKTDLLPAISTEAGALSGLGLFDTAAVPIVLMGTSYSAGEQWGLAAFLQAELQVEVLNLAVEARGPFAPMDDYLVSPTLEAAPPRLVIWEIPERYLVMDSPSPDGAPHTGGP